MIHAIKEFWAVLHTREKLVIAGLVLAAFAGGTLLRPRVVTKTVTEYVDRVQTVEKQVVVEKPVVQYRDRVITRYVQRPDGTKIETHVEEQSGKTTGEKVTTTEEKRTEDVAFKQAVTQTDAPRLHLILEFDPMLNLGPGPTLSGSVMAAGLYDFARIGQVNFFTGLEVIVPVLPSVFPPAFIVPLGVSVSR